MPIRMPIHPIRAFALAGAVAISTVAAPVPAATAAHSCTWTLHLLSMPADLADGFISKGDGSGRVSGWGYDSTGSSVPLIWSAAGSVTRLPVPGGAVHGRARDVNRWGDVLLVTEPSEGWPESYVLRPGRTPMRLASPPGGYADAYAINDDGAVVGDTVVDEETHAASWTVGAPGRYTDLGRAFLADITDGGALASYSDMTPSGYVRALTGRVNTGLRPLPVTVPMHRLQATGASGAYIVGYGWREGGTVSLSFVWKNGRPTALPAGFEGYAVSNRGVATGLQGPSAAVAIDGAVTLLPRLANPGETGDVGTHVTDDGRVFGQTVTNLDEIEPTVWTCA